MTITLRVDDRSVDFSGATFPRRVLSFSPIRRPLAVLGGAEAANTSVELDNGDARLSRYVSAGTPIGEAFELYDGDDLIFAGAISGIDIGPTISLSVDAGQRWRLYDPVPLRSSTEWTNYKTVQPIPIVYGRVTLEPIQYDADGRVFVVADGPVAVDDVLRDDVSVAYEARQDVDSAGKAVTFIELAAPLIEGERLAAKVRGRLDPGTGRLLENPGAVLQDFLARVVGRPIDIAELDRVRFEAESRGYVVAGAIMDDQITVKGQVDEILGSLAGVWSDGMQGFARLYPAARGLDPIRCAFDATDDCVCRIERGDIYTVLRISYGYDYAAGQPAGSVVVEAPQAIERFGRIPLDLDWRFSTRAGDAAANGKRLLEYLARPRAMLSIQSTRPDALKARPGDWVTLNDPRIPVDGLDLFVTESAYDPRRRSTTISAETALGPAPGVSIAVSRRHDPVQISPATVTAQDDIAEFTLKDPDTFEPLAGARVTLDGQTTRTTDNGGFVSFEGVAPGPHQIVVEAAGRDPFMYEWQQGGGG